MPEGSRVTEKASRMTPLNAGLQLPSRSLIHPLLQERHTTLAVKFISLDSPLPYDCAPDSSMHSREFLGGQKVGNPLRPNVLQR